MEERRSMSGNFKSTRLNPNRFSELVGKGRSLRDLGLKRVVKLILVPKNSVIRTMNR